MTARVALLLHMHQPDYRDPETGRPAMPWVRLHASRGYTDVPALAEAAGARFTMNVVPSLLDQLEYYAAGGSDRWEELSLLPAEHFGPTELDFLRRRFVHGHPAMRAVSPRYRELERGIAELHRPDDIRDLQVWSNLAWMGVVGRRIPSVAALIERDRGFSHAELVELMAEQRRLVAGVLPLWARQAGIATSPYTHPILPLLVDFRHAQRAMPEIPDEVDFQHSDDARRQIVEAQDRVEQLFGRRPTGMWPSEGSVSPEVARIASACGLRWLATDQGVLQASRRNGPPDTRRKWRVAGTDLHLLFRDRVLSDRIGFEYAGWEGEAAARDLLESAGTEGILPLILDGENPWESYPDAGGAFLTALFQSGRTLSLDEALPEMPEGRIVALHSGSWINANFAIWAGSEADRAGWKLLAELRRAWEAAGRPEGAWPMIRSAEGSDWFWWFGPEHHSDMHDLFDGLFRAHLAAGWRAIGSTPPEHLSRPVGT
jgi:alpha-amylase/alpha-mannosidase (GH57 family)